MWTKSLVYIVCAAVRCLSDQNYRIDLAVARKWMWASVLTVTAPYSRKEMENSVKYEYQFSTNEGTTSLWYI